MTRTLAASAALTLAILLAGCGGDDPANAADPANPANPADPANFATGADVADFCAALAEIDDAIDEAAPGDDADWERIVASFDALDEVGVPDDLPASGIDELSGVALLVRQSSSVAELNAAVEADPPGAGTIDDYIDDNCS